MSDTTVSSRTRGQIQIGQVRAGEEILVEQGVYEPVLLRNHAWDELVKMDMVQLIDEDGQQIVTLTADHMVRLDAAAGHWKRADQVRVGDLVGKHTVARIDQVQRRIANLITARGHYLVNGQVRVSCYPDFLFERPIFHAVATWLGRTCIAYAPDVSLCDSISALIERAIFSRAGIEALSFLFPYFSR